MKDYICIIGLEEEEAEDIKSRLSVPAINHVTLPKIIVKDGQLWAEAPNSPRMLPISKVVYHGIFDDDLEFIVGLALWGGPCLPNPRSMMDCRLKFPCLVKALEHTRFGHPRGYISPYARFDSDIEQVAKWGNWHCGENKERFTGLWQAQEASIVEPYFDGEAVRVVAIGDTHWQIKLEGGDWLKSIHHADAAFMDVDTALLEDTLTLKAAFGLEIIANDYIVTATGDKYLLEVNHIPNVNRFPAIWQAYRDFAVDWVAKS